jgi:hypothetical protein
MCPYQPRLGVAGCRTARVSATGQGQARDVARRGSPAPATGKVPHQMNMNAAVTIAPPDPQYMRALERANKVRLARADLKRRVAVGEIEVAEVILDSPWEAQSMPVADLLMSQRRWGQTRCRKFLSQIPMSEKKTVGSMTDRQRRTLAAMLRGVRACSERPCSDQDVRATPERDPWVTDILTRA